MAIRIVEFSSGSTKLDRFLGTKQHTQRKLLNFENWANGKVSKIEHHFRKQSTVWSRALTCVTIQKINFLSKGHST